MTRWELKAEGFSSYEEYYDAILEWIEMGNVPYAQYMTDQLGAYHRKQFMAYLDKVEDEQFISMSEPFSTARHITSQLTV